MHPHNEAVKQTDILCLIYWKQQREYDRWSLAETSMFRWKTLFREGLQGVCLATSE